MYTHLRCLRFQHRSQEEEAPHYRNKDFQQFPFLILQGIYRDKRDYSLLETYPQHKYFEHLAHNIQLRR